MKKDKRIKKNKTIITAIEVKNLLNSLKLKFNLKNI